MTALSVHAEDLDVVPRRRRSAIRRASLLVQGEVSGSERAADEDAGGRGAGGDAASGGGEGLPGFGLVVAVPVAVVNPTQCGTGFLADPSFRHQAAEATGLSEAALEASAVADPHTTVKADVERLLTSPLLSPKVSISGHVYDIATGLLTTTLDARYPQWPRPQARRG